MDYLFQGLFVLLTIAGSALFAKNILQIKKNILMGRNKDLSDNPSARWRNVFLLALGQKKMFRNVPVAIMHLIIYAGFIIINIEYIK